MTLLQLAASAQAPCSSTITGLAECPAPAAAAPAEAPARAAPPGAIVSRAAARRTARSAGRLMRRAVRLSDMSVPLLRWREIVDHLCDHSEPSNCAVALRDGMGSKHGCEAFFKDGRRGPVEVQGVSRGPAFL